MGKSRVLSTEKLANLVLVYQLELVGLIVLTVMQCREDFCRIIPRCLVRL
jgi:hypothetical protein